MAKPAIQRVNALDANKDYTFIYVWNGLPIVGTILTLKNLSKYTEDIIIENDSPLSSIDYDVDNVTTKMENGCKYQATIQVKYSQTVSRTSYSLSDSSEPIQFYTFETPKITIKDMSENTINVINTASFGCNIAYDNKGYSSNILNTYKVDVYQDADLNTLLKSSGVLYTKGELDNLYAYIGGLQDNTTYYVYVYGITNYGMETAGTVYETVIHYSSQLNTAFNASVVDGHVELDIHEHIITGHWIRSTYAQYDDNGKAIVTNRNGGIYFSDGFEVGKNFKCIVECSNIIIDNSTSFIEISEKNNLYNAIKLIAVSPLGIEESLSEGSRDVMILCLVENSLGVPQMVYSNPLTLTISLNEDDTLPYLVVSNHLIIELSSSNGYFNIAIREEV